MKIFENCLERSVKRLEEYIQDRHNLTQYFTDACAYTTVDNSKSLDEHYQIYKHDLEKFASQLIEIDFYRTRLNVGLFQVDMTDLVEALHPRITMCIDSIKDKLPEFLEREIETLNEELKSASDELEKQPLNTGMNLLLSQIFFIKCI